MPKDIIPPNLSTNDKTDSPEDNAAAEPTPLAAPAAKPKAKAKPLIEGINAPRLNADISYIRQDTTTGLPLTDTEKTLIAGASDFKQQAARLISETSPINPNKKSSHVGAWLLVLLILLILAGGGYGYYIWHSAKTIAGAGQPSLNQNSPPADNQPVLPTATPTSTPAVVPSLATASSTLTTPPPAAATSAPASQLTITQTPTGYLNVRSQPSTASSIITKVHPGESYPYTSQQNGWYKITLTDGGSGWVSGQYVQANR